MGLLRRRERRNERLRVLVSRASRRLDVGGYSCTARRLWQPREEILRRPQQLPQPSRLRRALLLRGVAVSRSRSSIARRRRTRSRRRRRRRRRRVSAELGDEVSDPDDATRHRRRARRRRPRRRRRRNRRRRRRGVRARLAMRRPVRTLARARAVFRALACGGSTRTGGERTGEENARDVDGDAKGATRWWWWRRTTTKRARRTFRASERGDRAAGLARVRPHRRRGRLRVFRSRVSRCVGRPRVTTSRARRATSSRGRRPRRRPRDRPR